MIRPKLITPPATRILTTAEAKAHLRVDVSDDDSLIDGLILAAESLLDGYSGILGRAMINQTWKIFAERWPCDELELVFPDVSSVEVKYYDQNNVQQTLSSSFYRLQEGASCSEIEFAQNFAAPSTYVRDDAIEATIVCGFGAAASDVPMAIRQAAKLLIGGWYENREQSVIGVSVGQLTGNLAVDALLFGFRRIGI